MAASISHIIEVTLLRFFLQIELLKLESIYKALNFNLVNLQLYLELLKKNEEHFSMAFKSYFYGGTFYYSFLP